ncbi:MAG: hypothetical protein ACKOZL_08735 [Actinomycetes bacterium]
MERTGDAMKGAGAPDAVTRLGILVVYFLKDDEDIPLLTLHLDRIERHTKVPYTIYAVANRVTARARSIIGARPNVRICDVPTTPLRASREHGYYLDTLLPIALADGVSHICTLDVDSFPIDDRWIDVLLEAAPPSSGLAGILRAENGDVALPHPSCIFAGRDFFDEHMPSFSPDSDYTPEFRRFIRSTGQAADTGIRVGATLWNRRLAWGHLTRSNIRNPHYLIAGIYGGVVFHLGGASRRVAFRRDFEHARTYRVTRAIEQIPTGHGLIRSIQLQLTRWMRGEVEDLVVDYNRQMFAALSSYLVANPDDFLDYLRGAPIPPEHRPMGEAVEGLRS